MGPIRDSLIAASELVSCLDTYLTEVLYLHVCMPVQCAPPVPIIMCQSLNSLQAISARPVSLHGALAAPIVTYRWQLFAVSSPYSSLAALC